MPAACSRGACSSASSRPSAHEDAEAYGSVRVMGTGFATGRTTGMGAALAAAGRGDGDVGALRSALMAQDANPA